MNKKQRFSLIFCLLMIFVSTKVFAFDKNNILSPVEGNWNNIQALVISDWENNEVYYSLSGQDPLVSGFSYDGPVIIEETGNVNLKIAVVDSNGNRKDFSVNYSVADSNPYEIDSVEYQFVEKICFSPFIKVVSGENFSIPQKFTYSVNNNKQPKLKNKSFLVNNQNIVEENFPVTITDGTNNYHFVLKLISNNEAVNSTLIQERAVPFTLENWTTFTFTGKNLIYQLDDELWSFETEPLQLDRSVTHTLNVQSNEYNEDNPITTYTIPAIPTVNKVYNDDNSQTVTLSDYRFDIVPSVVKSKKSYKSVTFDTIDTLDFNKEVTFDCYFDNIYQGSFTEQIFVNKKLPESPVITSSETSTYSRNKVIVKLSAEENCKIYYSVSKPYVLTEHIEDINDSMFDEIPMNKFKVYGNQNIEFASHGDKVDFYKIQTYCVDNFKNKSEISEYRVIVDQYNYYICADSTSEIEDGTIVNPYKTLDKALEVVNKKGFVRLTIKNSLKLENKEYKISGKCLINGINGKLVFDEKTCLSFDDSSVTISNMIISGKAKTLFNVRNSLFAINDCEFYTNSLTSSILFSADNSEINLRDSGFTVNAQDYSSIFYLNRCNTKLSSCRLTSSGMTSVCTTINGGSCYFENNSFYNIGQNGRSVEVLNARISIIRNTFASSFEKSNLVYLDEGSSIVENLNNEGL